jgi:hypothetical protein
MFFFSSCGGDTFTLYMGKDKFENEDLIRWGWPEDVWFHGAPLGMSSRLHRISLLCHCTLVTSLSTVDKLSSAHVYLRLPAGMSWEVIPADVLGECVQLVKANSIEGVKLKECSIVYTPWSNLKKTGGMDVGQVSYHNAKMVKRIMCEKDNTIVNRVSKTKREVDNYPHQEEREKRDKAEVHWPSERHLVRVFFKNRSYNIQLSCLSNRGTKSMNKNAKKRRLQRC